MDEMSSENMEKVQQLEINFMKIQTDIEYIKENINNFGKDFKEFQFEIRQAIKEKANQKEFIFWRNTGVAACITVIIQLLFLILDK